MLPDHLPTPAAPFIGRADELAAIAALLADPACRLLTIVGAGGIGKTRLALQAATDELARYRDGVTFVPLASVGSSDLLPDHQPRKAERFAVIEQARGAVSVTDLCEALEVSESGYYAWRETKANRHDRRDAYLTTCIQTVFDDSRHTYGSNRVEAALRGEGICTSRKRVARLMRQHGFRSVRAKKQRACLTHSLQNEYVVENLLAQDFTAKRENEKWVTDTTYVPTDEGWLYLVTVLDIYTRQIVGGSMGNQHDAPLATSALTMALKRQQPLAGLTSSFGKSF